MAGEPASARQCSAPAPDHSWTRLAEHEQYYANGIMAHEFLYDSLMLSLGRHEALSDLRKAVTNAATINAARVELLASRFRASTAPT